MKLLTLNTFLSLSLFDLIGAQNHPLMTLEEGNLVLNFSPDQVPRQLTHTQLTELSELMSSLKRGIIPIPDSDKAKYSSNGEVQFTSETNRSEASQEKGEYKFEWCNEYSSDPGFNVDSMLQQVNQIRKSNGLNELQLNIPLIKTSNWQVSNQVKINKISHDGPEGTYTQGMKLTKGNAPHYQRVLACKFTGWPWGENTAEGRVNITNVMTDWMKSEGHKENILRPESKYFGAAKVGKYWVQSFGKDN